MERSVSKRKIRLEYVEFLDHWGKNNGWNNVEDFLEKKGSLRKLLVIAAGWVVFEDSHQLLIAGHMDPENYTFSGAICILKSTIIKRKRINK